MGNNLFFKSKIKEYEKECINSNVSIDFCYNSLMFKFQNYKQEKNKIELIKRLDFKDSNRVKVLLNKKSHNSKEEEIDLALENFKTIKKDLFDWLDKTSNPYFFILQPFYKFGSGINFKNIDYRKDNVSGIENIDIASDYANYILLK